MRRYSLNPPYGPPPRHHRLDDQFRATDEAADGRLPSGAYLPVPLPDPRYGSPARQHPGCPQAHQPNPRTCQSLAQQRLSRGSWRKPGASRVLEQSRAGAAALTALQPKWQIMMTQILRMRRCPFGSCVAGFGNTNPDRVLRIPRTRFERLHAFQDETLETTMPAARPAMRCTSKNWSAPCAEPSSPYMRLNMPISCRFSGHVSLR